MVFSSYKQQRILYYHFQGVRPPTIKNFLAREGMTASKFGIRKFLKKYEETGSVRRRIGSGRPTKVTAEIKAIVEEQMRSDDETTAHQLHAILSKAGYSISLRTVLRCRVSLGWIFTGSRYCQLIREANKAKRLEWARQYLNDNFKDVVFTDESSIQMEAHRRFACRKIGERPKPKPRCVCMYV